MSDGRHTVLADEPPSVGGGDRGGNPFEYLLWSLAACTVMTVRMYADRKKWPLESVTAYLRYRKEKDVFRIEILLEFSGVLDDDQSARLVEMAHRCPVHRTLTGDIAIQVTAVSP